MSETISRKERIINAKKLAKKNDKDLGKVLIDNDKFYIVEVPPSFPGAIEGPPLCIVAYPDGNTIFKFQFDIPEVNALWQKAAEEDRKKWEEEHKKKK